jgi:hypothetical protein
VLYGVLAGLAELDHTGRFGLPVLAAVLLAALVARALDGDGTAAAVHRLGLGRPSGPAVLVALAMSALVLLVYPVTAAVTGASRRTAPGLAVAAALDPRLPRSGRGDRLARLRVRPAAAGRTFGRAVAATIPLVAATHLPIVAAGQAVGLAAMLVAAATTLPPNYE